MEAQERQCETFVIPSTTTTTTTTTTTSTTNSTGLKKCISYYIAKNREILFCRVEIITTGKFLWV